jgi:uncharacterized protein (TIGR00369 family)
MAEQTGRPHSAYADYIGYELTRRETGGAEVTLVVGPQHLNRSGIPHGGLLATLLDTAAGFAIAFAEGPETAKPAVTLSLSILYLGQAKLGDTLVATGRHTGGGRTVGFATAEIRTQDGMPVARAEGVFRYLGAKGLGEKGKK